MKKRLLTATAIAAVMAGSSAYAADMNVPWTAPPPTPPQFSWSGCHAGFNMGLGDGHLQWQDTQPDGNIDGSTTSNRTAHTNLSGGLAGAQLGCDMQFGPGVVMGIAGSYDWSDIAGTNQDQFNAPWTLTDRMDWYATVTGRLGAVVNHVLVFGRGGAAFAHNNFEIENSGVTLSTPSDIRTGWTLGAGLEWPFAPNWSVVLEGDYYSFGAKTETFNNATAIAGGFINPPFTINVQPSFETVTLGINYRFGGGLFP
jgi:outer membrane immunogenic protein